ncbi:MAG: CotH kinase family protein [Planctomycetes bacterium]|nr:CotH kinase family protein [Planctomycetota bacterium]
MRLWYGVNGSNWQSITMTANADGRYTARIPAAVNSNNRVVQFYVEGRDARGVTSTFPAAGRDSRALYQVSSAGVPSRIEQIRLVMLPSDNSNLFSGVNRMSNNFVPGTFIRSGQEAFYDVGIRQIGSRYIRPNSGYKVRLNPDQPYFGVHDSIRLDINQLREIILKQMVNRAGGSSVSIYNDIAQLVSPQHGTRNMLLNLARYEDIYLDEQFENGGDGTKFELDDITFPTGSGESLKSGTGVSPQDMFDRGDNPEFYRAHLLIKNNRSEDDFSGIVAMSQAMAKSGTALYEATNAVMDVDLWMRHYATQAFVGNWDTYGFRRPKNLRIYSRPSDGKMIPLYWDADLGNLSDALIYNGFETRLDEMRNIPQNTRLFWGHMLDLVENGFNGNYIGRWVSHYSSLGAGGYATGSIASRATQAIREAKRAIAEIDFAITSPSFRNILRNTIGCKAAAALGAGDPPSFQAAG